jgi:hypothetical protein
LQRLGVGRLDDDDRDFVQASTLRLPRSRNEATSSSSSVLENTRRGLRALGRSEPVGTRRWPRGRSAVLSVPTSPINAARPRPKRDRVASSAIAVFPKLSVTHLPAALTAPRWRRGIAIRSTLNLLR